MSEKEEKVNLETEQPGYGPTRPVICTECGSLKSQVTSDFLPTLGETSESIAEKDGGFTLIKTHAHALGRRQGGGV